MIKRYMPVLFAVIFFAVFFATSVAAKEDTAQITLKKISVSKQKLLIYTVKKGDDISSIIKSIPDVTDTDVPDVLRTIKELNPDIKDLNKLHAGQLLVIPGKDSSGAEETKPAAAAQTSSAGPQAYTIKKGDSLIRIIHRELSIKTSTMKTLKIVKTMNPRILDVNKIYAGQVIKLPGKTVYVKAPEEGKILEQVAVKPADSQAQPEKIIEVKEKINMPPEERLAVIKQVIGLMKGSVATTGNYYVPLTKTGQVTIDCTKIPVIELDDNTTIFLDLENSINDNLKKMILDNWKNFRFVKVDKKDDVIAILKKVIAATPTYSMTRRETPITIGSTPPVEVMLDWIISKTDSKQTSPPLQGLRIVPENGSLLPKAIKNYSQKNGLAITEIDMETGLAGKPEEIYSLSPQTFFPTTSAKDFSFSLVAILGFNANKDVDIKIFDKAKDGLDLSIKTDIVITNVDKKYIIYSRSMPEQFINILKKSGYELIFTADTDSPKITMEKVLRSLGVPFVSGYFTFSGIDRNQASYNFGFTGTKIRTGKDMYVIDFEIDQGLRGLVQESWSASIARY